MESTYELEAWKAEELKSRNKYWVRKDRYAKSYEQEAMELLEKTSRRNALRAWFKTHIYYNFYFNINKHGFKVIFFGKEIELYVGW